VLRVSTILRSGFEQVTKTDPSDVGNRTIRMMPVSTIFMGATPRSDETCLIVAKHASKLIVLLVDCAAAIALVQHINDATADRMNSLISPPC
jgi:hypothetical protein